MEFVYMRSDAKQMVGVKADPSPLLGSWTNTNPETDYISRIIIRELNGDLVVHAFGASSPEPVDWGEAKAAPYVAGSTRECTGLYARYEFESVETHLAANQKLGILVIQSYTSFKDGSGRLSHYAREFFHR
jgi:hypothetical protein